jgi:ABC-2 type transport system permease protein
VSGERAQPGWQVVLAAELRRIWLGWWGPLLLLVFSIFLSVYIVILAADPEMNVLSQRMMINQTVQIAEWVGVIVVLVLGADTFSGERDRGSLESLLLTPVPRGQLVIGKLLALVSLWLGMIPIALPYVALVAKGTGVEMASLVLLVTGGTLLVGLSAATGVLASGLAPTNLVSFASAVGVMLALLAPALLPASARDFPIVHWLFVSSPVTAVDRYQSAIVDGEAWTNGVGMLLSPVIALALAFGLGPRLLDRRLSLQGGLRS